MKTMSIAAIALAATFAAAIPGAAAQDAPAQASDADAEARAAVDAALAGMGYAKLAVSERYAKTHAWVHDAAAVGFEPPAGLSGRVEIADGTITATFDAPASIAGKTLQLVPSDTGDGTVHWRCEAAGLPDALKPKGCA
ncbi:MAG: pilin [Luteimonas sp.]